LDEGDCWTPSSSDVLEFNLNLEISSGAVVYNVETIDSSSFRQDLLFKVLRYLLRESLILIVLKLLLLLILITGVP
jgi:hypothetical protein